MKIIHSYKPLLKDKIEKKVIYQMTLSALLAQKHYGNIHLYCDNETAKIIKEIGIEYTSIDTDLLKKYTGKAFALPKMYVYAEQDEPFIHIDIDTLIFNKIDFKYKTKIYYAFSEGLNGRLKYNDNHEHFYNTYIKNSFEVFEILEKKHKKFVDFNNIYNMCIFGGWQYDLIQTATKYCLKIYEQNQEFIDSRYTNNAMLEQMLLPGAINMFAKNWGRNVKVKTIFKDSFFNTFDGCERNYFDYPVKIQNGKTKFILKNQNDLFNHSDMDFDGFLHLNGYKDVKELKFLTVLKLFENFDSGLDIHNKIVSIFGEDEVDLMIKDYYNYKK